MKNAGGMKDSYFKEFMMQDPKAIREVKNKDVTELACLCMHTHTIYASSFFFLQESSVLE